MACEYHFRHGGLGELIGLQQRDDVVQFRGIPFASIPQRFAQSNLTTSLPRTPFDARYPGPICPQPNLPYPRYWAGPLPADLPVLPLPAASEFECLNLNITVPKAALESSLTRPLPVLFFLHGGGLAGGSQSIQIAGREIYDPTNLVRASLTRSQPIIVVTANYRVGAMGFLASAELAADHKVAGAVEQPAGNYGLYDQLRALEWCERFMTGFGGDPSNLTAHGSSAGAASIHYHCALRCGRPARQPLLFRRAIISSGSFIGTQPMPLTYHQPIFNAYVRGAQNDSCVATPEDPVSYLRSLSPDALFARSPANVRWAPWADETWIKSNILHEYVQAPGPKPDLMVGAAEYERENAEHQFMSEGKCLPDDVILSRCANMMQTNHMLSDWASFPDTYPAVAAAYGLDQTAIGPDGSTQMGLTHPSVAFAGWTALMADIVFRVPPLLLAQTHAAAGAASSRTPKVFVYCIHATNPFPLWPTSYRRANHAINETFVFDVAADCVPPTEADEYRGAVAEMQRAWINFTNGNEPWTPSTGGQGPVYVFRNGSGSSEHATVAEAEGEEVQARWQALLEAARGLATPE